jgi:hypothetical protein
LLAVSGSNYVFKPTAELLLRDNRTLPPRRLNTALGVMGKYFTEVREVNLPKARGRFFELEVRNSNGVVFDSSWLSLRLEDTAAGEWLRSLVLKNLSSGVFLPPLGHGMRDSVAQWQEIAKDDFVGTYAAIEMHVEHLSGPSKGGSWFWAAGSMSSADLNGVRVRGVEAGKWLSEMVARSLSH